MRKINEESILKPVGGSLEEKGFNIIRHFVVNNRLSELLQVVTKISDERRLRYKDYEEMSKDPLISSALELVTEDATQVDSEKNLTVWADPKCEFAPDIDAFFRKLDLEGKIWGWTHKLVKYGDFFLGINAEEGMGIVSVDDTKDPGKVFRIVVGGVLSAFYDVNDTEGDYGIISNVNQPNNLKREWQIVHFINNYNPSYEKIRLITKEMNEAGEVQNIKRTYTSAYGASYLANSRTPAKVLNLQRQTLALARVANAPIIRAVYINIQDLPQKERRELVTDVSRSFKSKMAFDKGTNFFDSDYNPLNFNDVVVIPVTGSTGDLRVEEFGGRVDIKDIVDVEFTRNELFGSLRIPAAFLGSVESLPGLSGNTTLLRLDIRYARSVKKVQRSIMNGLLRLCQIHLSMKYKKAISVENIRLKMVAVSDAEEASRMETIERKISMVSNALNMVSTLGDNVNPVPLLEYVFKSLLGFSDDVVAKILEPTKDKAKLQLKGGAGFTPSGPASEGGIGEEVPEEGEPEKGLAGGPEEGGPEEGGPEEGGPEEGGPEAGGPEKQYSPVPLPPILSSKITNVAKLIQEGKLSLAASLLEDTKQHLIDTRDNMLYGKRENADFDAASFSGDRGANSFSDKSVVGVELLEEAEISSQTQSKAQKKPKKSLRKKQNK